MTILRQQTLVFAHIGGREVVTPMNGVLISSLVFLQRRESERKRESK
jgi:hypothetical protein